MDKRSSYFFVFLGVAFALILALEIINGRFWLNDFKVYYGAADAFFHAKPVYGAVFGEDTGLYKYAPLLLWFFAPAAILPYPLAAGIHFGVIGFCFVIALRLAYRMSAEYFNYKTVQKFYVFLITTAFCMNHLFRELHLGNVNVVLVALLLLAFHLQQREQFKFAGFLFALCIFVKPYFLLLGLPFLLAGKWQLIKTTLMSALAMLLLFAVFTGFSTTITLHQLWFESIKNHSEFLESFNTVAAIAKNNFGLATSGIIAAGSALLILSALFLLLRKNKFSALSTAELYNLFCIILAVIPCLVITDTEHFLFALPLMVLLITQLLEQANIVRWLLTIIALVLYSANLGDVIGDDYSVMAEHSGLLGIGNLSIIVLSLFFIKEQSTQQSAHA